MKQTSRRTSPITPVARLAWMLAILFFSSTNTGIAPAAEQMQTKPVGQPSLGQHYADVDGVSLWYEAVGTGPLLVVVAPGWGPASEYLRNGLKPLEKHFTLLYYDPRGSGRSKRPADAKRMSTSDMVDDLERLRRFWGVDAMTLLGHSHGGSIALGYAIQYPTHVRKLVLVDAQIIDEPKSLAQADFKRELSAREHDRRFATAIRAENQARAGKISLKTDEQFNAFLNRTLPLYFYDPVRNGPRFARLDTGPLASVWAANAHGAADDPPMKQYALLGRVTARTSVIVGRADWICPVSVANRIHTGVPNSRLLIVENSGHFPWIENPQEFFPAVIRSAG